MSSPMSSPILMSQDAECDNLDVWAHLQNAGACTFHDGTNPLSGLVADVCVTLALFTSKGECLRAMVDLYDASYDVKACTLGEIHRAGVDRYVPPPGAPRSVRDLFSNRHGFIWQADLERAMTDVVAWAADWNDETIA